MVNEHIEKDENLIGLFALGIRFYKTPTGHVHPKLQTSMKTVPLDTVIMQLKFITKKLEDEYNVQLNNSSVQKQGE